MISGKTRTILLVDGSSSILSSMEMLLKRLEYKVAAARSAEDALRIMERTLPSIVLTDLVLPAMSGLELIRHIKDPAAGFKAIPVVVLTSINDANAREECARMGCAAYLTRPVDPEDLYRTMQTASESAPRGHIRLETRITVIVGDGTSIGGTARTEYASEISEGGLYVNTRYPQPRNALTPVTLLMNGNEVRARAMVLYTCKPGEGAFEDPGMGMKFVDLPDADRELIRRFIREQLKPRGSKA